MRETISDRLPAILSAAIPFVEARRKKSGGFGSTPGLPATIEDTYHALSILALAQRTSGRGEAPAHLADEGLRSYLAGARQSMPAGTRTTFHLLQASRIVGLEFAPSAIARSVLVLLRAADSLDDWYYGVRILTEILHENPQLLFAGESMPAVLTRQGRTVDEVWMQVYLAQALRVPHWPPAGLAAWFQACQNGDGGFGFLPGTTSFVENCHYCLRALATLGAPAAAPDEAYLFIAGCQTAFGGLGRSYRAAPFLDATWHGLASLQLLEDLCHSH